MGRKGPHSTERDLFARVLNAWQKDGQTNPGPRGPLASTIESFTLRYDTLALLRRNDDVDLTEHDAWIVGRPIEGHDPGVFPVVSAALRSRGDALEGTVRVALLHRGTERLIDATGWRFETAESRDIDPDAGGVPKPHTYPHAQPCSSWHPSGICLIHPDATPEVDDATHTVEGCPDCFAENSLGTPPRPVLSSHTRPAFPLRNRTVPGLALSAVTTIYGARVARDIIDTDTVLQSCSPAYAEDFRHILGEPEPETGMADG